MAAEFSEGDAAGVEEASSVVHDYEENAKDKLTSPALLLIIVGEPFSPQHKDLIAERIAKGLFMPWFLAVWNCGKLYHNVSGLNERRKSCLKYLI